MDGLISICFKIRGLLGSVFFGNIWHKFFVNFVRGNLRNIPKFLKYTSQNIFPFLSLGEKKEKEKENKRKLKIKKVHFLNKNFSTNFTVN